MKNFKVIQFFPLLVMSVILTSCDGDKSQPNPELIQDMMVAPSVKAQSYDETSPNNISSRVPPENTVPVGFSPYKYPNSIDEAAKNLKNPLAQNFSEDVLIVGQRYYGTHCTVCHGAKGEGGEKTSIGAMMALKPPSLLSEKVRQWNDAQIYHTITMGQGLMGPYSSHIPQKFRWQVVNYIRHLQK